MFSNNKLSNSFLVLAFCFGLTVNANAAENKIFIKLHDIKPIKTGDLVTDCELKATLFNNTDMTITSVNIDTQWEDKYLEKNKLQTKRISANIEVDELKPSTQITKKIKISTDRCFLLTEEPKINTRNCKTTDRKDSSRCSTVFQFVSPMDDEYYAQFKEIVENSEKTDKKVKEEIDNKLKDINNIISSVITTNDDTVEVLKIKENEEE